MTELAKRRVLLIEVTLPAHAWSSAELEQGLAVMAPILEATVYGEVARSDVDAAFKKLRQLSRETEADRPKSDRIHSAHKALSFFRDLWPATFRWQAGA